VVSRARSVKQRRRGSRRGLSCWRWRSRPIRRADQHPRASGSLPPLRVAPDPAQRGGQSLPDADSGLRRHGVPAQPMPRTAPQRGPRRLHVEAVEEPALKHVDLPTVFDPVPRDAPYVSGFRPSPNGYWWPLYNHRRLHPTGPSALFGRFMVVRFKAPSFKARRPPASCGARAVKGEDRGHRTRPADRAGTRPGQDDRS
jgi:hypothetical protein